MKIVKACIMLIKINTFKHSSKDLVSFVPTIKMRNLTVPLNSMHPLTIH